MSQSNRFLPYCNQSCKRWAPDRIWQQPLYKIIEGELQEIFLYNQCFIRGSVKEEK